MGKKSRTEGFLTIYSIRRRLTRDSQANPKERTIIFVEGWGEGWAIAEKNSYIAKIC